MGRVFSRLCAPFVLATGTGGLGDALCVPKISVLREMPQNQQSPVDTSTLVRSPGRAATVPQLIPESRLRVEKFRTSTGKLKLTKIEDFALGCWEGDAGVGNSRRDKDQLLAPCTKELPCWRRKAKSYQNQEE